LITLALKDATKRYTRGVTEEVALDTVSLEIDAGQLVGVWGRRRSGRSTLVRVAAGVVRPDSGIILLDDVDIWSGRRAARAAARQQIAFWLPVFLRDHGSRVYRQVAVPARRRTGHRTRRRPWAEACQLLERVGLDDCATRTIGELNHTDIVLAALARALMLRPRVLVLDEPTSGLKPLEADRFMELLVRVAREDQIAVLVTASEVDQLGRVDRTLTISDGALRGTKAPDPQATGSLRSVVPRLSSG
jgi:ABC-type multidrug transport system ATPase subunit